MKISPKMIAFISIAAGVGIVIAYYDFAQTSRVGEDTFLTIFGIITIIVAAIFLFKGGRSTTKYGIAQL